MRPPAGGCTLTRVHNTDRILTTHVGSLVRPPEFRRILEARRDGGPFDQAEYERVLRHSVIDVVRNQAEAGVDVVSDGEFGKSIHWAAYVLKRLSGLEYRATGYFDASPMAPVQGRDRVPRLLPRVHGQPGLRERGRRAAGTASARCPTPGQAELQRDIDNLKAGLAEVDVRRRLPPCRRACERRRASICPRAPTRPRRSSSTPSPRCCASSTTTILDAGLILQIDDAFLPWTYDLMVPPATMDEYRAWAQLRVDALNHALRGLPEEPHPVPHLLGQLQHAPRRRRPREGHRRPRAAGQRGLLPDRDGQPPPRARVARVGGRPAARREGPHPGRHHAPDQRRRASRARRPSA